MTHFNLLLSLEYLPGILLGLTIHEFSHAWMAEQCGDDTSKKMGRVSLNPLRHIDPIGFILLLVAGFGWAKPVQFNEKNLRNPSTDVIKIALAGPFSNALLAILLSVLFMITFNQQPDPGNRWLIITREIFLYAIWINWALFVFNLIPIPPLDGSHLFFYPLRKFPMLYSLLYRSGMWILLGIILLGQTLNMDFLHLGSIIQYFFHLFVKI